MNCHIYYDVLLMIIIQFQLPKINPNIDSLLHQKLMEMHRRNTDQLDQEMQHQKDRQMAELEVWVFYSAYCLY